jgi:hypothetical protein
MNTIKSKFSILLLSMGAVLVACDKEDEKPALSVTEAKQSLNQADTKLAQDLEDLSNAQGYAAIERLSELTDANDPFPLARTRADRKDPKRLVSRAIVSLKQMASRPATSARTKGDEPFDYDLWKGVYTWNPSLEDFEKTGTSQIIEIRFPTEGSTTNNAVFRLTDYDEVATPDGDEAYSPTVIEATLDVNGTKEASISAEVQYRGDGTDEPKFADVTYFVKPFTFEIDLDDTKSNSTSFSQTLRKGDDVIIGWGLSVLYKSNIKDEGNINTISGFFQLVNVKFEGTINPNATDPNTAAVISITVDGRSAGQLVFEADDTTGELVPYVKYSDGTKEPLENIFDSLEDALDDLDGLIL